MKRLAILVALLAAPVAAQEMAEAPGAQLRILDKLTGEVQDVTLARGQSMTTGRLTVQLDACRSPADNTVAEAMALIRNQDVAPALAASVFVTLPPYETVTGRFLGVVHFQRMLRYPPHERLATILDTELEPVSADTPIQVIHRTLANYNLVALPVVDAEHRLIGVVTVDDVLDHLLPDDWRTEEEVH